MGALIPAAEYVRMSTEEQANSIPIQQAAIQRYARERGFQVVATYSDAGRSGMGIRNRPGLCRLLNEILTGQDRFHVILVYDVSRWGRFQNTDESAYYEFLCRSAGVRVHYCAEQFENDDKLPNSLLKSLKRSMAAEYSRELAVRVSSGQKKVAAQGFINGGIAGYGFKRAAISLDGKRKVILRLGEWKNIGSDRIVLVPGDKREVNGVQQLFTLAERPQNTPGIIAEELNRRGIEYTGKQLWNYSRVYRILKNEKYIGTCFWGRTQKSDDGGRHHVPRSRWVIAPNAFPSLVNPEQFARVQAILRKRNNRTPKSEAFYLRQLKRVLEKEGDLNADLLTKHNYSPQCIARCFGSTLRAYQSVGYKPDSHTLRSLDGYAKMQSLKAQLLTQLMETFPGRIRIMKHPDVVRRKLILIDGQLILAVHFCVPVSPLVSGQRRWRLKVQTREEGVPALLCLCNKKHNHFDVLAIVPALGAVRTKNKIFGEDHPWVLRGRLNSLQDLCHMAATLIPTPSVRVPRTVIGDVVLEKDYRYITIGGVEIQLPPLAAMIFWRLLQHPGQVIPRDALYHENRDVRCGRLNCHISVLRTALGQFGGRIRTIKKQGYMYEAPMLKNYLPSAV
jgi:DNA invertase Pin-like site-specific DNA recombinase